MKAWRVARVLILLLWVVAAAMTWWTAPREVSYEKALDAAKSGEVRAYDWGMNWDDGSGRWLDAPYLERQSGPWFAWRTSDYRVYWADTSPADGDQTTVDVNGMEHTGAAAEIARELDQPSGELIPWRKWIQGISAVLALTFFAVLIIGPAPALGTRWYWFWVVLLIPYALGMVFWVLRDRPWSDAANEEDRDHGWFGLAHAIAANLVITVVLLILNALLGDRWIPEY
ncbi:hypothetical protein ACTI_42960 [Actinoplanes sp. OR16]|uniref:hypothetical protein n=1 Tax=Actinoplanes sp. OR16 TaxID=946334 RepID=UPI000F6E643F|nr:hypothetical protein [Actinoplanes sp. OR16]BBH67611.1 hypothetical protein ACTI_42960 [Actinoplanes sp. OR16]